ncbi:metallophosphoesterase family protein [Actinoplanes auranticolor]|uniref:Membrane protein n=1 Tax=Actinoplanes auranticolor TaxID=47988 RepID=A0A919SMF1_9ACTN|nr:metallophosphoesterase [Actinoplanes auranticolor]GIM74821.1 membrane protein [Actinoplanes auranticolor]
MNKKILSARAAVRRTWQRPWARRLSVWAAVVTVSLTGVVVGTMLFAQSEIAVGPFRADMSISPSVEGGTEVQIPPLGSLHLDSHDGPIHLKVDLGSLDQERTEALIDDPTAISAAGQSAVDDVTKGVLQLGLRALGAAIVCALILSALIFRNIRRVAASGVLALVVTGGGLGLAAGTIRPDSISEPRYEGLLVNAPAVVGDARRIADNYGRYADQLQQLVSNVSRIYTTVSTLPVFEPAGNTTRLLHVSDLHLNPTSWGVIRTVVKQWDIDAVVDTGDIVDWGSNAETSYVSDIGQLGVPYVYVRGNHDSLAIQAAVARQKNAIVLDDTTVTINGLTLAGIGDPEFTPDKSEDPPPDNADELVSSPLLTSGERLATTIRGGKTKVDVALVHDPAMAPPLSGVVPLVLAGHTHKREVSVLAAPSPAPSSSVAPPSAPAPSPSAGVTEPPQKTRMLVQGSTGGAGLRGLEKEEPTPLMMSVLYFDETQTLKAYDDIQLGGTGEQNVTMQRNLVGKDEPEPTTDPSAISGVTPETRPNGSLPPGR